MQLASLLFTLGLGDQQLGDFVVQSLFILPHLFSILLIFALEPSDLLLELLVALHNLHHLRRGFLDFPLHLLMQSRLFLGLFHQSRLL